MRLLRNALIPSVAVVVFAFSPDVRAANVASVELHTQANDMIHPAAQKSAQKKMKSKSAINKPKGKAKAKNY
jgi:hypothetical protein